MADEEGVVSLKNDFYRERFGEILFIMTSILSAIILLVLLSVFLFFDKPLPITFPVSNDWRIRPPVPVNQPYLSTTDLLQWVSNTLPKCFVFDFNRYDEQSKVVQQYFTPEGWKIFLNQLNIYANYNNVQAYKLFVNGEIISAPFKVNDGLVSGRFAWWIQVPLRINYTGSAPPAAKIVTFQVLLVRVPTLDNLMGIAIDNVILAPEKEETKPIT